MSSGKKGRESSGASCPFYKYESSLEVRCEGIVNNTKIATVFADSKSKVMFKTQYCDGIEGCQTCKIYQLIYSKYKEI